LIALAVLLTACGGGGTEGDGINTSVSNPVCDADAAQMLALVNANAPEVHRATFAAICTEARSANPDLVCIYNEAQPTATTKWENSK